MIRKPLIETFTGGCSSWDHATIKIMMDRIANEIVGTHAFKPHAFRVVATTISLHGSQAYQAALGTITIEWWPRSWEEDDAGRVLLDLDTADAGEAGEYVTAAVWSVQVELGVQVPEDGTDGEGQEKDSGRGRGTGQG